MAVRFRRLSDLRQLFHSHPSSSGNGYHASINYRGYIQEVNSHALSLNSLPGAYDKCIRNDIERSGHIKRYSTAPDTFHKSLSIDLLSYIKSTLDELEGPSHCWLNKSVDANIIIQNDGVVLVLAGSFTDNLFKPSCSSVVMVEKVKSLQQRYPSLSVIGFQSSRSIISDVDRTRLLQTTLSEYITFPILVSKKAYSEMTDGACYIISRGFKSPPILYNKDTDLGIIDKAIKELNVQHIEKPSLAHNMSSTWVKPVEVIQEPDLCSSMQRLLLYFPGCISIDEIDERVFLSDVNHHRIIVSEYGGKILDCIGSSPGFEDGDFESAKLTRPTSSFYHAAEDSLYFVDSENHAIRRADMESRVVETVYPKSNTNRKGASFWSWIVDKIWTKEEVDTTPVEFDSRTFLFPWHLIKSSENDLFVLNRSFETLWIMDLATGVIKEVINGFPNVMEICGQMILEKSSLLKQMPSHWLKHHTDFAISIDGIPYAGLMSSVASIHGNIIICDTVGQMVLKLCKKTGLISSFQFSNFGVLGLPYWLSLSLERVYPGANALTKVQVDHIQHFTLLPGRIETQLNIDIPEGTELVEPLQEGSIWRQTRGTGTEISGVGEAASLEKVGAAQQWYNDLDSLASLTQEVELTTEEENNSSDPKQQDGKIRIDCTVNTSPGTCEVIVYAALYLRMKRPSNSSENTRETQMGRLGELLNPSKSKHLKKDACLQLLSASERDPEEFVFVRPLHVRLKIDCLDHPKAENSKDIILTDASIEVNIPLK